MVATPSAHARAGAVGVACLFLFTLIPALPTAAADDEVGQDDTGDHIEIVQGSVYFRQNGKNTQFVANASLGGASEATIYVPVVNYGVAVPSARFYITFANQWGTPGAFSYNPGDRCRAIELPAGTSQNPTTTTVAHTFTTSELPPGAYNVTVHALVEDRPDAISNAEDCTNGVMGTDNATSVLSSNYDRVPGNNVAQGYLVKDKFLDLHIREIRWCEGAFTPDREDLACDTDMLDAEQNPYNVTPPYGARDPTYTWFEAVVEPVEGEDNWMDLTNYGGPNKGLEDADAPSMRDGFPYHFNVTARGSFFNETVLVNLSWNETTGNATIEGGRAHRARSEPFALDGRAGIQNVTVKVDPAKEIRRHLADTVADTGEHDFTVISFDFTAVFHASDFRTSSTNPYPYDGPSRIRGNITLQNLGTLRLQDDGPDIAYTVYLDNMSQSEFWHNGTIVEIGNLSMAEEIEAANEKTIAIDWEYTDNNQSARFLLPGRHTINISVDAGDQRLESNESNNNVSIEIFIVDSTVPDVGVPKITQQIPSQGPNAPAQVEFKPREPFNVFVDVEDDDDGLSVVANFTLNSDPNVTREYPYTSFVQGATEYYVVQVSSFNYHDFANRSPGGFENWTMRIVATDSFNNTDTSAPQPFRLVPWPIHSVNSSTLILEPVWPADEVDYGDSDEFARFKVRILPNQTGYVGGSGPYPNQQFFDDNLAINISAPGGDLNLNGTFWTPQTHDLCNTENDDPTPGNGGGLPVPAPGGGSVTGCPEAEEPNNNTFLTSVSKRKPGGLGPGVWNYSIRVSDIANQTHIVNGTLHVLDQVPQFEETNISVGPNVTITPGASFRIFANVSDDDDVVDAFVNFSRPLDGVFANFTLVNGTDVVVDPTTDHRVWNDTILTGRGQMLGFGGVLNVTIHAVDAAGNWNRTSLGTLTIQDGENPEIDAGSFGVIPGAVEIGENVTFWAKVHDTTNVTVTLNVFRAAGSDEILLTRQLEEGLDGNFTTTLNFTTEALHSWELVPVDSVKNIGARKTGLLTVRDNLGPKYEVRSPDVLIDGTIYGSGTPRIDVVVYDIEGVVASSIDMRVAGQPVSFQVLDAPGNLNGYLVTYTIPANRKFNHLDVVDVNLTARDNSTEQLTQSFNFSFVVDDEAPTARLRSTSPSYRDQPAHTMNVSLSSLFTLAAEDVDDLPTEVASIRYRIIGGGPGGPETVYSAPFRISDGGVYTGPRVYQVQFWAEDAVGNSGARNANVTSVYVDDAAPTLIQFFPQPRSVNATFLDDRVGVNNSVLWIRINDAPYTPQEMQEIDGTWRGTLPAGRLGDTVSYYVQVWDKLGNTVTYGNQTNPYGHFDVSNQEPTIRILTPVEGARVPRQVELTWDASEPDGQALVFKVSVKKPGSDAFVELRELRESARRAYMVDLSDQTSYRDGEYVFRVTASDGAFVSVDDVTVTLIKSARPVGEVLVDGTLAPGEELLITAEVTKAEALVSARLYLGDTQVRAPNGALEFPMNDEGRDGDKVAGDGIYSTKVRIDDAGDYRVEIFTQYREDGVTKTETIDGATFSAKLTPSYVMGKFGALIAVIGLLAAVGIGVAVFVVMRRR